MSLVGLGGEHDEDKRGSQLKSAIDVWAAAAPIHWASASTNRKDIPMCIHTYACM